MDDQKLITLVESHDILYNKSNKRYRIPDKKRAVWLQISKEMGVPEELCISRWSSLRDRYAKEKKNENLASEDGASFTHRWKHMNQLAFLAPHVISRKKNSSVTNTNFLVQHLTPDISFSETQCEKLEFLDDEKLITLVESHDILYNKLSKDYRTPDKKRPVWLQISKEMGVPEELCIRRWSSLRDRYVKEKKIENLVSGSGASFTHRWQHMSQLEFLAPHIISREKKSSVPKNENYLVQHLTPDISFSETQFEKLEFLKSEPGEFLLTSSIATSNSLQQKKNKKRSEQHLTPDISFSETEFEKLEFLKSEPEEVLLTSPGATSNSLRQKKNKKRSEMSDDSDQIFADAVDTFKKFCKSKEGKDRQLENDAIHGFGKMVVATLQSLNETKQTRAIKLITDVLTQLKLEPE